METIQNVTQKTFKKIVEKFKTNLRSLQCMTVI